MGGKNVEATKVREGDQVKKENGGTALGAPHQGEEELEHSSQEVASLLC